jgi:pimeloyl-ACP methyl ester carboxylesterase
MVDIGSGKQLYLNCSGKPGSPTVILEAGSEATSHSWAQVQPQVARFARVCSYDRAGLGRSSSSGHEESVAENVADLHSLLQHAGISPPYLLVGHSSGGLRVQKYQAQFPTEVAGMVLVDSAHEEQIWRFSDAVPGSVRGIPADPANLPRLGMLPPRQRSQWHTDIPLIVVEHTPGQMSVAGTPTQRALLEYTMHALQEDLAKRSTKGELRTAAHSGHSGHDIPNDEPRAVVLAIRDVMSRVGAMLSKVL